jgi:tetratricopeptide (TPR) repeat protein
MFQQLLLSVLLWQAPSFVEQSITSANEAISKEPNQPAGYNDLALALVRKARQTGDASFIGSAEAAVAQSLKLAPANFDARRARVAIRVAQHRYEDALEEAEALRKARPDDNTVYEFIAAASNAVGDYPQAEKSAQRMLDLRSVNVAGFESGAAVREIIGFPAPAIEWWQSALHLVSDRDSEERAFINVQMARIYRETGKYPSAAECAQNALRLEPDYPAALVELARVRIEQKRFPEAASLLQTRLKKGADLESLYWLASSRERMGAANPWAEFETAALKSANQPLNANALLIRYLAEHGKADQAIRIAEKSLERRHDLATRQAYAVALARAGRNQDALKEIRVALEPGFLDASLYFDAGMIAKEQDDREAATVYFKKAFELGSDGMFSTEIMKQLGSLSMLAPN